MPDLTPVPGATPRYDDDGREIVDVVTCGSCGRSWNDAASSSVTPAPSGRCPFEYEHPGARLEYLRGQIRAECISWGEVIELQGLAEHIDRSDVELLEWAGVPEFPYEYEQVTYSVEIEWMGDDVPTEAEIRRAIYQGVAGLDTEDAVSVVRS